MQDNREMNWPGWETVKLIGRGSFGAVYEIERKVFDETEKAALKVISIPQNDSDIDEMYSDGYDDESITSTFQSHLRSIVAEYSLMRKMNGSANIVNCDDIRYVQHDDGIGWDIFIKMELLTPLIKALPAEIPEETVVKIAKDMCNALVLCKNHEIVHRDIKPQNIFVSEYGDYKLGDFGIAKTVEKTMGGTKIGTYKYMAPEVYNNQPYGSSADIYSLGLVLYWLLNERRMPFLPLPPEKLKAGMDEEARHRRLSGEKLPPPAHGSEKLKRIVLKACAYDPKDRYASAVDMLEALTDLTEKAIPTSPPKPTPRPTPAPTPTPPPRPAPAPTPTPPPRPASPPTPTPPLRPAPTPEPPKGRGPGKRLWIGLAAVLVIFGIILVALVLLKGIEKPTDTGSLEITTTRAPDRIKPTAAPKDNAEHRHSWIDATCTSPRFCDTCGETSGNALKHDWISATSTTPKTCSACGSTQGRSTGVVLTKCLCIEDSDEMGSKTDVNVGNWVDCFGDRHANALRFWVCNKDGWANMEYAVYELNGQHDEVDIAVQLEESSQPGATAYVNIYLDGTLVYTSPVVGRDSAPVISTLHVDEANRIRIECVTDSPKFAYCIVDAALYAT